ncbi:MAG: TfuA-like protein [Limisphaerales bacterium]
MPDVVIFLGPSLSPAEARRRLDADYRPPVRRGDLLPLLADPPRVVGIVDGVFFQRLAISPKEILRLLEAGTTVVGAASMGALRAVELGPFGMLGVGRIHELYRSGAVTADDEVAMAFDPETFAPASEPLANIRLALADAQAAGILTSREQARLLLAMRRLHFPERSHRRLLGFAAGLLPADRRGALEGFLRREEANAKRQDALALLEAVRGLPYA